MENSDIKTPMDEQTYNEKLKKIDLAYHQAKVGLYIEFAKSHEKYKIGDIISDSTSIILIDNITSNKSFGLPEPVYHGPELKKDLTPKKNSNRHSIYGSNKTNLIKSV